jgi:hypothetical protein
MLVINKFGILELMKAWYQLDFTCDIESKVDSKCQPMDEEIKQGISNEVLSKAWLSGDLCHEPS